MAIVRVSEVLRLAGITSPGIPIFNDAILQTSCPTCKETQLLSRCSIAEDNGETLYKCMNGCQTILIVGLRDGKEKPGRGYRLNNYIIRNISDLELLTLSPQKVFFPRSPAALD